MTNCIYNIKHCYSIQDIAELEKLDSDWRSKDQVDISYISTHIEEFFFCNHQVVIKFRRASL